MLKYVAHRIALTFPILTLVIVITFTLGFYAPGDPVRAMYGERELNPETLARLRQQYGLDRPYPVQLADFALKLTRGDFGRSIVLNRPVGEVMARALPISAQIGLAALVVTMAAGIPLGILCAVKQNSWIDYTILFVAIALASIPVFVLAPLLMIALILHLQLIPSTVGWAGLFSEKAILPVVTLAMPSLLSFIRYTRASVLEVLSQDYIRTARAKGLPQRLIVTRHIVKNSMTPVLTAAGLSVPYLITGSIFLENIFGIPGFGKLVVDSLQSYDYPMILGTTIVVALLVMATNLITDLLYGVLDPRVRLHE
jgi:ABC-type dipeptide/oligopeptide/nickel transport system permease component